MLKLNRNDYILKEADFATVFSCPWKSSAALIDFIDNIIKPHPNRSTLLASLSYIHVLVAKIDSDEEILRKRQKLIEISPCKSPPTSSSAKVRSTNMGGINMKSPQTDCSMYNIRYLTWKDVLPQDLYHKLKQNGQIVIGWMLVDEHSLMRPKTEEGSAIFNPCGVCLIDFIDTQLRGHSLAQYMIERFEKTNISLLPQEITAHAAGYWYHSKQLAEILDHQWDNTEHNDECSVLASLDTLNQRLTQLGLEPTQFSWETLIQHHHEKGSFYMVVEQNVPKSKWDTNKKRKTLYSCDHNHEIKSTPSLKGEFRHEEKENINQNMNGTSSLRRVKKSKHL